MDLFDLVAKITLDSSEAENGIASFGSKLKGGLGTVAKVGGAAIAAVGAATAALGTAMVKGASEMAAYGDNIDKMSQKMGISAQAYQEWDAIMQHSGTSIDGMQRGMMTLSKAAESGSEAFEKLGLSQEEVASMNQEELFAATIKGLQGMEAGSERTALAQELLGGAAKELGPLLNTSAEETEAMRQRVHELGGVMSDEAVKAAAAYQDSLQDMQTAFQGLKRGLFTEFMPSITTVMDGLAAIFSGDSDNGIQMISDGIEALVDNISEELPAFLDLGVGILESLATALIKNLPKLLESGAKIVGQLVAGLVRAIPKLIVMAPQLVMAIVQGLAAAWPEIKQAGIDLVMMAIDGIQKKMKQFKAAGKVFVDNVKQGFSARIGSLVDAVRAKFEAIKAAISNKFTAAKTSAVNIVTALKTSAVNVISGLVSSVSAKFDAIKTAITSKIDAAKTTVSNIVAQIKGFFSGMTLSLPNISIPSWADIKARLSELWDNVKRIWSGFGTLTVPWKKGPEEGSGGDVTQTGAMGALPGGFSTSAYGGAYQPSSSAAFGPVTINVYPQRGQDERTIAREIERILVHQQQQRSRAYA